MERLSRADYGGVRLLVAFGGCFEGDIYIYIYICIYIYTYVYIYIYMGLSEIEGYLILGVPIIRILAFRVLY